MYHFLYISKDEVRPADRYHQISQTYFYLIKHLPDEFLRWVLMMVTGLVLMGSKISHAEDLANYVNTLRGGSSSSSFSRGMTFPAVSLPFGFTFWSPVTNPGALGNSSWFYAFNSNKIYGFGAVHLPSPWIGNRQTMLIMPLSRTEKDGKTLIHNWAGRAESYRHDNEIARPDYYSVTLDNGLTTEFTPSNRAAFFRFTYPAGMKTIGMVIDKFADGGHTEFDANKRAVYGWTTDGAAQHNAPYLYFYARFNDAIVPTKTGDVQTVIDIPNPQGKRRIVEVQIGTSLISVDQARQNLDRELPAGQTFETTQVKANHIWNQKLSIITMPEAPYEEKIKLYSNMYRAFLYPNRTWEWVNGKPMYVSPYLSGTGQGDANGNLRQGKLWVNNGFWDTYRTTWPLYTLLLPNQVGSMLDGFILGYKDGGWVARWSGPGYVDSMVSTSSDAIFADAYTKGIRDFDINAAYESMLRNASTVSPHPAVGRKGMEASVFLGYTPTDIVIHDPAPGHVAWSLEAYINDYGIAQMAKALGRKDEAVYFRNRALNYTSLFRYQGSGPWAGGWFRSKNASGIWSQGPYGNPAGPQRPSTWGYGYTEGDAWHYAVSVPHDGNGLAMLYGNREALASKLDALFTEPTTVDYGSYGYLIHEIDEADSVNRLTGLGQYNHANQPSHHIIYMYNHAGQPYKAQDHIRRVMDKLYTTGFRANGVPDGSGYLGDDDNGEQSAWYVFNAMGFYPLALGSGQYVIGVPRVAEVRVKLQNGKTITVLAPGVNDVNRYIQSVRLNGKPYHKTYLLHSDLVEGATLEFTMGPNPSTWGTSPDSAPDSLTPKNRYPSPDISLIPERYYRITGTSNATAAATLSDRNSLTGTWSAGADGFIDAIATGQDSRVVSLTHYTLTSTKDPASAPKSWVLLGSNDGASWDEIDRRSNVSFKWPLQTQPFAVPRLSSYRQLRLKFVGGASNELAEFELYGRAY